MDIECTLNSYNKDGIASTFLKVRNVAFDGNKVHLQVVSNDGARLAVLNVIGDELISAVQKCMLNWEGV